MRRPFARSGSVPAEVLERAGLARGDRVLARAPTADGAWLLGTRDALVIVAGQAVRVPWERVETADWNRNEERLRVSEVGEFGQVRPVHVFSVPDPGPLLAMIRERVTASVLLQRRVTVADKQGLLVIARRSPRGRGEISWAYELDSGLDPADPAVQIAAQDGLRSAQEELGLGGEPI